MKHIKIFVYIYVPIIIAIIYSAQLYLQAANYIENTNPKKYDRECEELKNEFKKMDDISSTFDPQINTEITGFDFNMNVSVSQPSNNGFADCSISKYDLGEYCLSSTKDGKAIIKIISTKLKELITKNYNDNVIIKVKALGTADGTAVKSTAVYDGDLGQILNIDYYRLNTPNKLCQATLEKDITKMTNEYFALLRAYDVVRELRHSFIIDPQNIRIYVEEYAEIGEKYRKCDLSITLENAFLKDYEELNGISKLIVKEKTQN